MLLKQCQLKPLIWLMAVLCYLQPANAQQNENSLLEHIPADSLLFMAYFHSEKLPAQTLNRLLGTNASEDVNKILHQVDEACFYGQKKGAFDHYTLLLKGLKDFSFNKADSLLKSNNLKVTELNASYALLDGGRYRKGIFRFNKEHYELKIIAQTEPIDEQLKKEYNKILKLLHSGEHYHTDFAFKLDSIDKLDSISSRSHFKAHIEQAKNSSSAHVKRPVKLNRIFDENMDESAAILYFNTDYLTGMPFYLNNMFGETFYDLYQKSGLATGAIQYYQDVWLKLQGNDKHLTITSIASNRAKQKHLFQAIDNELIKYLPANASALYSYNMQLSSLKNHLARYFMHEDLRDKEQAGVKLALLAFDDQLADALGNGFIALTDTCVDGRDMPNFKMALYMPNKEKGEALLSILENDLDIIHQTEDHLYRFNQRELDSDIPLYLNTRNDIWLMGTGSIEALEQTLSRAQLKQLYPELAAKKISQYLYIDDTAFSELKEITIKQIKLKTRLLDKTRAKTTMLIEL